jgi:hypothetical protein
VAITDRTGLLVIGAKAANTDNIAEALITLGEFYRCVIQNRVAALMQLQMKTPLIYRLVVYAGNQVPAGNSLPL